MGEGEPETGLARLDTRLQTGGQCRQDVHAGWVFLTGVIHGVGKILCLNGEPQWAVVGDTFPVGCAYSETIVFHKFFADNPDSRDPRFQSRLGVYQEGAGLDQVCLSWGHDEYLYHVVKDHLPDEALYMIRYHSFYPGHREGAYAYLLNDKDRRLFESVRAFNPYDLYTKYHAKPDVKKLRPFYEDLSHEYFPDTLRW